jgi:hypothetical protein
MLPSARKRDVLRAFQPPSGPTIIEWVIYAKAVGRANAFAARGLDRGLLAAIVGVGEHVALSRL